MASMTTMPKGSSHCSGKRNPLAWLISLDDLVIGQPLDVADLISVNMGLNLL